MSRVREITNVWKNIREVDLRPIRESALQNIKIILAGSPGSGRNTLASQLRVDPTQPQIQSYTPIKILDLNLDAPTPQADLIVLLLDAGKSDFRLEEKIIHKWGEANQNILVFVNKVDTLQEGQIIKDWIDWPVERIAYGSATQHESLKTQFIPVIMEMLPNQHIALARQFPLFRGVIAHHLINDACFSNATYALSTGIAEIFPALGVPLNIADIVVLTKAQAFLVYKLGLALGLSTEWRDYVTEFGSVIGSGFIWRQIARSLVGLIPVWGIIPKVSVAYAGTYVVGNTVWRWYITGKHLTRAQMRELYRHAFIRGKNVAREWLARRPRLKIGRRKQAKLPPPKDRKVCPHCEKENFSDAEYCQYCGRSLTPPPFAPETPD
jgi:uncharacterized protein (DUF697 family)